MSAVVEQVMVPYHQASRFTLYEGDCRSVLPYLSDCSVDSIVCDPPYELGFMGKGWDRSGIAYDVSVWSECLRVLKPGGHLLAFGGSRTYHRLACAIEDAGFEIRDQIQWLYGSGFPKSLNIQQAINKAERGCPQGTSDPLSPNHGKFKGGCSDENPDGRGFGAGAGAFMAEQGEGRGDDEGEWNGWGTALKPAHEPIVLARKPLIGTVAENVLQHGTGGLNIDGCRIGTGEDKTAGGCNGKGRMFGTGVLQQAETDFTIGRWPANVIHDGSDEVRAGFPEVTSGTYNGIRNEDKFRSTYSAFKGTAIEKRHEGSSGSAARFFYCAKATQEDRNEGLEDLPHRVADDVHKRPRTELDDPRRHGVTPRQNFHPTVKPTELMRYLCRLVTPPGGLVLDPFCGSGSTGKAAVLEGLRFIGIELNADYCQLAQRRIEAVTKQGLLFA